MGKRFVYLASTTILVAEIAAGGLMDVAQIPYVIEQVRSLGYPTYLLYIIGVWKLLAVVPLVWGEVPRLREWAYAGVFFEMLGAAESHLLAGQAAMRSVVPLAFTVIALISWWSQPRQENVLG